MYLDYVQDTDTAVECANEVSCKIIMRAMVQNDNREFYQPRVLLRYR